MRLPEWDDPDRRDAALARMAVRLQAADPLTRRELAVIFLLYRSCRVTSGKPLLPTAPSPQDIADALVALGLVVQAE